MFQDVGIKSILDAFGIIVAHVCVNDAQLELVLLVVSATKLPILNPNEFDLWKMRIEQYFLMTDYSLWEVILNRDSPAPIRVVDGVLQPVAPTTVEQKLARKNELKARGRNLGANGPTSLGFDMSKVECYNFHVKGHFVRECRSSKDSRKNDAAEPQRRNVPVETSTSNALVSQCLESIEAKLLVYKQNESIFEEDIKLLNLEVQLRDNALVTLRQKLEKAEQERDDLKLKFQPSDGYHVVPPPYTGTFMPPKANLVFNIAPAVVETGHSAFNVKLSPTKLDQDLSHTNRPTTPIIEDWVSDSEDESETKLPQGKWEWRPKCPILDHVSCNTSASMTLKRFDYNDALGISKSDKGVIDSGCSWHIIGNMSYLFDFEELNGGYVAFRGNPKGGPTFVKSMNKKSYYLVVIDDYSREFNIPRTPQQNGIAERKNRTLTKAARTMLADSLLPIPFWAEAVNTACYVQNRVLVTKPHNKTPYELLYGRTPSIGFMTPFGCPVTILNTLDFLENKPNVAGSGPTWLFDIDSLTKTMNYKPITVGNQSNPSAGFQDKFDVEKAGEEGDQQYVLFLVWSFGSTNPYNTNGDALFDGKVPEFDEKKPESEFNVSPSSSAQSKKQDDKTKREAKGKSLVESFIGYRDLSVEFEDYYKDSINEVNADGTLVLTVGQISPNSTNTFSAAGNTFSAAGNTFSVAGPLIDDASPTHGKSSFIDAFELPDDPDMPELEDITYSDDEDDVGAEADYNNLETSITVSPIPTIRVHKDHHVTQIIEEPNMVHQALKDPSWIEATQEELLQFKMQKVWVLVDFPYGKRDIVKQKKDRIFISQDKYVAEILRKFRLTDGKSASTPIDTEKPLLKDPDGKDVDVHTYSKEDFRYLKGKPHLGLWYPKDSHFDLVAYSDSDYAGASQDRKSTTGGCQFLGCKLISWQCKKQTVVATSSTKAEYIVAASYYAQVLWIQNQLLDYGNFGLIDTKSARTPIDIEKPLLKDPDGEDVDVHTYRSMIGSLMYLTSSRPDIMFAYEVFENDVTSYTYLKCWFTHHTTNRSQFTMSNPHQELASLDQTVSGKDSSNSLMADNLPKIVWYSTHRVTLMKSWLVQKQMALDKDKANPLIVYSKLYGHQHTIF
nr:hypothetical protein [Tanacetum cinerariifolium]